MKKLILLSLTCFLGSTLYGMNFQETVVEILNNNAEVQTLRDHFAAGIGGDLFTDIGHYDNNDYLMFVIVDHFLRQENTKDKAQEVIKICVAHQGEGDDNAKMAALKHL